MRPHEGQLLLSVLRTLQKLQLSVWGNVVVGEYPCLTYLLVPVQRVDDQFHHAANFGFKGMLFGGVTELLHLCHVHAIELETRVEQ